MITSPANEKNNYPSARTIVWILVIALGIFMAASCLFPGWNAPDFTQLPPSEAEEEGDSPLQCEVSPQRTHISGRQYLMATVKLTNRSSAPVDRIWYNTEWAGLQTIVRDAHHNTLHSFYYGLLSGDAAPPKQTQRLDPGQSYTASVDIFTLFSWGGKQLKPGRYSVQCIYHQKDLKARSAVFIVTVE